MNYCICDKQTILQKSPNWQGLLGTADIPYSQVISKRQSKKIKYHYCKFPIAAGDVLVELTNSETDKQGADAVLKIMECLCPLLTAEVDRIKGDEAQRTKRLKHNLITHNAMILQEIYNLIPQSTLADKVANQIQFVSTAITNSKENVARGMIRILKNASLSKAEFDIHDVLTGTSAAALKFDSHRMHKLLKLTFSSFWLDFVEKNITVDIHESTLNVSVDYKTISAALCHLLDNAVKYILKGTDLHVHISLEEGCVVTEIDMISLKIFDDEANKIFNEYYSGILAKQLGLDGHGIGMYVVGKFIQLNNGNISVIRNRFPRNAVTVDNIAYEQNVIRISLPKG
jgi:signal transduction histidine kinase